MHAHERADNAINIAADGLTLLLADLRVAATHQEISECKKCRFVNVLQGRKRIQRVCWTSRSFGEKH